MVQRPVLMYEGGGSGLYKRAAHLRICLYVAKCTVYIFVGGVRLKTVVMQELNALKLSLLKLNVLRHNLLRLNLLKLDLLKLNVLKLNLQLLHVL